MRLTPIEITEETTLEEICHEVYQCYIHLDNTRVGYRNGSASISELDQAMNDLHNAIFAMRKRLTNRDNQPSNQVNKKQ